MLGHKSTVAELRVVLGSQQADPPTAGVWPGRRCTFGRSPVTALPLESAVLTSRCHGVIDWQAETGTAWLTDCSLHGCLVLELEEPSAVELTPEELDALPWDTAQHVNGTSFRLESGSLVAVGLHAAEWLGAVRADGFVKAVQQANASVLAFTILGSQAQKRSARAVDGVAPALPPLNNRLPFARTPAKATGERLLAINTQAARHQRIRDKHGAKYTKTSRPPVLQAYNLHQLAQAVEERKGRAGGRKPAATKPAARRLLATPPRRRARKGKAQAETVEVEEESEEEEEEEEEEENSPEVQDRPGRQPEKAKKSKQVANKQQAVQRTTQPARAGVRKSSRGLRK